MTKWDDLTKEQRDHLIDEYLDGESAREWVEDMSAALHTDGVFVMGIADIRQWWEGMDEEEQNGYLENPFKEGNNGPTM